MKMNVDLRGGDGGNVLAGQGLEYGGLAGVVQPEEEDPQLAVRL